MQVTLEEAYAEACRIIGEQTVERRLLARVEQSEQAEEVQENHD